VKPLVKFWDPRFRNSLSFRNFWAKAFRREDLSQSGWLPLFPVVTGYGVSQPGQIRDKHWAGDPGFGGWTLIVLSTATVGAVPSGSDPSDGRAAAKTSEGRRKQLQAETVAAADRIAAEAHLKLPRSMATAIEAIYVRFSTLFQDSAVDQMRELFDFAVENKIFVPREYVFFDLGVRGHKNQREGLDQLRTVLAAKKVQVLLLFATNRLFRKVYLTLQFVEQTAVENGIRCVFLKSAVDTADKDQWRTLLHMRAMMDEFQVRVNAEHIRAALEGMFLECLVRGTIPVGYKGEPIPGKLTKRGKPRCRIVIDSEEKKFVVLIFEWFVQAEMSRSDIARKLNAMPCAPRPRKSKGNGWNRDSATAVLKRTEYRGLWKFSVTEKTFLPSKDHARQIPREKPLNEATFENLRIVSDALWFAAQARLPKDSCIPGCKPQNEESDPARRVLSGLLWCSEHDRPLRAWSANGDYLGCPTCATLEPHSRPLFSKPHRTVVLRLLCERLAALIPQDADMVSKIIAACEAHAAAIQRPDASEIARLEKSVGDLTRKIDFNMRHPVRRRTTKKKLPKSSGACAKSAKASRISLGC
jgi:DNA invertase Pin-like site-specific DNA recombinase